MTARKRTYVSVFGVSHEHANLSTRQEFYLSESEYEHLLMLYKAYGINNVFVLNTCNRTEVYVMSDNLQDAINIYRNVKQIDNEYLHNHLFIKYDKEALDHFFAVGSGLKSKILGDYQIIGQMRTAFNDAKEHNLIATEFERLFQALFSAAKEINSQTALNHGSASHGYHVVSIINKLNLPKDRKILLIGAGDMAQKTLAHLLDYSKYEITMVNRTYLKLQKFEGLNGVNTRRLENLPYLIKEHVVVISTVPVACYLNKGYVNNLNAKVIFDLSVPSSIATLFKPGKHKVYNIDDIEQNTQQTIAIRKKAIPQVEQLIEKHVEKFYKWCNANKQNQVFRLFESELEQFLYQQNKFGNKGKELNPQKITELFMKSYYSKLNEQTAV